MQLCCALQELQIIIHFSYLFAANNYRCYCSIVICIHSHRIPISTHDDVRTMYYSIIYQSLVNTSSISSQNPKHNLTNMLLCTKCMHTCRCDSLLLLVCRMECLVCSSCITPLTSQLAIHFHIVHLHINVMVEMLAQLYRLIALQLINESEVIIMYHSSLRIP